MRTPDARRGLSLIELVVILAITVVFVAVLISHIESSRELARRQVCASHLKALGLALHNYHAANGVLPMSAVAGPGHGTGQSCFTQILPYIEQVKVYNTYNFDLENWHVSNATAVRTRVASFLCPENTLVSPVPAGDIRTWDGTPYSGRSRFERTHYGANWGGGHPPAWGDEFVKAHGVYQGVLMTVQTLDGAKPGPEGKAIGRNVGLNDITDGTSYTLALAEKLESYGWCVGGWGGSEFDVNTTPVLEEGDEDARRVYTGSNHQEGVQAVFCDGSVHLLTPTTSREIWFALQTRAGHETIPLQDLPAPAQ